MGCHTWTYDLKIATDITKTDANQEVIRLLKESDNEIDKDYLENYQAIHILETFIPQEYQGKSRYFNDDFTFVYVDTEQKNRIYPIFRTKGYPEFVLEKAEDIQILKDFVKDGGILYIPYHEEYDVLPLTTDFNSDKWKAIEQNINELYQSYPTLLIRFG